MTDTPDPEELKPIPSCSFQACKPPVDPYDTVVTFIVGSAAKNSFIHRGLLSHYSGYFSSLLNGRFLEGDSNIVTLPDEAPEVFELFFTWLDTGRVKVPDGVELQDAYLRLLKLYVFGDKYIIPRLKNDTMETFFSSVFEAWRRDFPNAECIDYLFENTPEGSPMRRLLTHMALDWGFTTKGLVDAILERFPEEAASWVKIFGNSAARKKQAAQWYAQWHNNMVDHMCAYHDHAEPTSRQALG